MLGVRSYLGDDRMIGFGLFLLTFFTLPLGITEGQPLLVLIPALAWIAAIIFGG